ncbi:MAG TPA: hypothetical protein VFS05_02415 [Gemmatimonadaceae bacterium]|nr:hypothetical protein [Gemmatimonadaceae bacterium]
MRTVPALALAALTFAAPLRAQVIEPDGDAGSAAAYFAITTTPLGALPPMVTPEMARSGARGMGVRGQFGYIDEEGPSSIRVFGAGVDLPVGPGTLALTAGYLDFACDDGLAGDIGIDDLDCKGGFIGGTSFSLPLVAVPFGANTGSALTLGFDGSLGVGHGDVLEASAFGESASLRATSVSAGLGLPVALAARSGSMTIVPHLTPRFAWGRASLESETPDGKESDAESGTRFMLGGGFGLLFQGGLGVHLGFQKVFIEDGNTLIGVGVSYAPK